MQTRRYRQMLHTLAFSFLVLCVTNQFGGVVMGELGRLIAFLVLAGLIFFIINRSSALWRMIAFGLAGFAGLVCAFIPPLRLTRQLLPVASTLNELTLPCRFQRPPPILFQ